MKLELAEFPVKRIILARRLVYGDETLEVDEPALLDLAREIREFAIRASRLPRRAIMCVSPASATSLNRESRSGSPS